MRIGVLTLPLHINYGGILQAYALQKVLQDMGHDVVLLDSYPQCPKSHPFPLQQLFYLKRLICRIASSRTSLPIFYERIEQERYPQKEHVRQFYRKNICHIDFDPHTTLNSKDFDALIVGSDQIWRPFYTDIYVAYLSFAEHWPHLKRVAYAASFGTDEWEYSIKQTKNCCRLVQLFDAVSVREESGIHLCREHLKIDASLVLDPTMLVDSKHYIKHIKNVSFEQKTKKCLSYILDETEEKNAIINYIVDIKGYHSLVYRDIDNPDNNQVPSVEEWLSAFYEAEFVFTDSFHGCIFSILFNKPFIVYGNVNRGMARFHSLLSLYGLEERLVTTLKAVKEVLSQSIDWDCVNARLSELRNKSHEFLTKALGTSN